MYKDLGFLLYLVKHKAMQEKVLLTTSKLAEELNISQQSASRKLKELEEKGLIEREVTIDGIKVTLTQHAINLLKEITEPLKEQLIEHKLLRGTLATGLGEGKFYMQQKMYRMQFKALFNFDPFPGTMNLKIEEKAKRQFLAGKEEHSIQGFINGDRSFGPLKAYPVHINEKVFGAAIVPERTSHTNIIEIIAPINLRDHFNLKDGDSVDIS